jgi:hypothetical protein
MVERELWVTLLAYNLIRKVIATAADIRDSHLFRLRRCRIRSFRRFFLGGLSTGSAEVNRAGGFSLLVLARLPCVAPCAANRGYHGSRRGATPKPDARRHLRALRDRPRRKPCPPNPASRQTRAK